jgi:hypothetical protein
MKMFNLILINSMEQRRNTEMEKKFPTFFSEPEEGSSPC